MNEFVIVTEPARELRRMARAELKGRFKTALLAYVLYVVLLSGPVLLLDGILGDGVVSADLAYFDPALLIVSFYPLIIGGPLLAGLSVFFLALVRGAECGPGMILSGFNDFFKAFGLFLLFILFMFLLIPPLTALFTGLLLAFVPRSYFVQNPAPVFLVFAAVFLVLFVFMLRYAQAFFLFADDPRLGTRALGQSRSMMRGNKRKLFCLMLSFAGWYLLPFAVCCAFLSLAEALSQDLSAELLFSGERPAGLRLFTFAPGFLFAPVQVYLTTTLAIFYDILTGRRRLLPLRTGFRDVPEARRGDRGANRNGEAEV
jgi:uncharacterized membrane protein